MSMERKLAGDLAAVDIEPVDIVSAAPDSSEWESRRATILLAMSTLRRTKAEWIKTADRTPEAVQMAATIFDETAGYLDALAEMLRDAETRALIALAQAEGNP